MEPQLPSLCHQTSPLPSSAKVQPPKPARRNLSKAEISANLELHDVKAEAWFVACTEPKSQNYQQVLVLCHIHTHNADVAIHLTKYRVFLSKPIFCHFKEFLCTSLSTSWIGKSWNVCSKRLLICYCAIAACVFFKPTSAAVLRFSTNADSVFQSGGKMERNGK